MTPNKVSLRNGVVSLSTTVDKQADGYLSTDSDLKPLNIEFSSQKYKFKPKLMGFLHRSWSTDQFKPISSPQPIVQTPNEGSNCRQHLLQKNSIRLSNKKLSAEGFNYFRRASLSSLNKIESKHACKHISPHDDSIIHATYDKSVNPDSSSTRPPIITKLGNYLMKPHLLNGPQTGPHLKAPLKRQINLKSASIKKTNAVGNKRSILMANVGGKRMLASAALQLQFVEGPIEDTYKLVSIAKKVRFID